MSPVCKIKMYSTLAIWLPLFIWIGKELSQAIQYKNNQTMKKKKNRNLHVKHAQERFAIIWCLKAGKTHSQFIYKFIWLLFWETFSYLAITAVFGCYYCLKSTSYSNACWFSVWEWVEIREI